MATNTYVALDKKTVASAVTSVTFTSIPSTYTDLVIVISASASTAANSFIRFNGDATSGNYSATRMYGNGSTATSSNYSTETFSYIGDLNTTLATTILNIQNYANTTTFKSFFSQDSLANSGTGAWAGLWDKSPIAAITSIEIGATSGTLSVGSTVSLYGILAEGISPAPKATGGAIYSDSTYYYHSFASTGVFTPLQSLSVDYLIAAGGGGAGGAGSTWSGGGGGGGGQVRTGSSSVTATNYSITVGGGGPGGVAGTNGSTGTTSVFNSITSSAGLGGVAVNGPGNNGGNSGGGFTGGTGAGSTSPGYGGGGGGGSSANGINASGTVAGIGGAGTSSTWQGLTSAIGGGGGGGLYGGTTSTTQGLGVDGGANGNAWINGNGSNGNNAAVNRSGGGGGAGGGDAGSTFNGGAGGSGIVIIRYLKA